MRMNMSIRSWFSIGFIPTLLLGLCAFAVVPHGKPVHARVLPSRSVRTAARGGESYLMVDSHEGTGAQSVAIVGHSVRQKHQPRAFGKTLIAWLSPPGRAIDFNSPVLLARSNLEDPLSVHDVSPRSPRGPPSFLL